MNLMPTSIKRGDTYPPLRGLASDEDGPINMTSALSVTLIAKNGATLIGGTITTLAVPDADGFNWTYNWGTADTSIVGIYNVELEVRWATNSYQTIPNDGYETLTVVQDQGGH